MSTSANSCTKIIRRAKPYKDPLRMNREDWKKLKALKAPTKFNRVNFRKKVKAHIVNLEIKRLRESIASDAFADGHTIHYEG